MSTCPASTAARAPEPTAEGDREKLRAFGHAQLPHYPIAGARPGAGRFPLFALRGGNVPKRIAMTHASTIALSAPQPSSPLVGRAAARDVEHAAGRERAFGAGQPGDQRGDLLDENE